MGSDHSMNSENLRQWIGKSETRTDTITLAPLLNFTATLDRDDPVPQPGDPIPPAGHWLYFLPDTRQSELGSDGIAKRGGLLPPVALPRRMWAGGRIKFLRPLRVGSHISQTATVADVSAKDGRTGKLVFVLLKHVVSDEQGPAIEEERDIVYRGNPDANAPPAKPSPAPASGPWRREIRPDPTLLFRYSALTFNTHRIHYDRPYTTGVEGYPALIVHGPLIATLLMDLCRRECAKRLLRFDYRAASPLFDNGPFTLNGRPDGDRAQIWAANADGGLAMTAEATFGN
jgi:3-methylfumaryl-CoA hydratase